MGFNLSGWWGLPKPLWKMMEWKSVGIIISNIWTKTCSKPPTSYDMSNKKTHVTTLESQGLLRCYHTLEKIWHMNTYDKIHRNHQVIAFSFAGAGFWMDFATILCESEQLEPKFLWKTWPSCPLTWPWLGPDLALTWPWLGHLGLSDPSGQCATHLRMELRMELEKLTRYLWENERLGSL